MAEAGEIIQRVEGKVGRLTLNRPQALHALNEPMCQAMIDALLAWRRDATVQLVVIDHATGTRGFCAGGDIRMLAESGAGDGAAARSFFFTEYRLNHLLHAYKKPIVAFMDGITMGGGVGISDPAPYRIATERTTYAMPETGIGLFPDVGGGWHLPRLPGKVGLWLALTGARIKAADCLAAGLCTHFVASGDLPVILSAACAAEDPEAALRASLGSIQASPAGAPIELTPEHRAIIDRCFAKESVEAIFAALEQERDPWAEAQLKTLHTKCPQTMKVAFRQLNIGAEAKTFAEVMRMEYRIGARMVHKHDFQEGVRAVIIDKDNAPKWSPASLAEVKDSTLDEIFAALPADQEWSPLPD